MSIVRTDPFPTYDAEEAIRRALDAGASGYLLKDSSQDDLITALLAVHRGEPWLPANIARRLREHTQEAPLSPRQIEVLELLAKGLSNKEIAVVLGFTTGGTKAHLRAIFANLGVADRTEAVVNAIQRRLASLGLNANPASRPPTTGTGM